MADYHAIIIGSGSAGGVLAERLTDGTNKQVLLVEAGVDFSTHLAETDADNPLDRRKSRRANATQNALDSSFSDWGYAHEDGSPIPYGKMLGGSSAHNGLQSFRGTRLDFSVYPEGWHYDDLKPFFEKVEAIMNVEPYPRINWDQGALAFEQAALDLVNPSYSPIDDFNQAPDIANGVGPTPANIKGMTLAKQQVEKYDGRQSVLETFLEVARDRTNLTIKQAVAERINLKSGVAESVTLVSHDEPETITGDLIISCAGVFGSPTLLMRSGIGPKLDIDLPAVGQNYQNQPLALVNVVYDRNIHPQFGYPVPVTLNKDYDNFDIATAYLIFNIADPIFGAATSSWGEDFKKEAAEWRRIQGIGTFPIHGTSWGTVTLDPTKPNSAKIDFTLSSGDLTLLWKGIEEATRIANNISSSDLQVVDVIDTGLTLMASHGIGTCAMGTDPINSVVNTDLRVHGVENLMVCDGSVMPSQVQSPHINISAIAYKIADEYIKPDLWGLNDT